MPPISRLDGRRRGTCVVKKRDFQKRQSHYITLVLFLSSNPIGSGRASFVILLDHFPPRPTPLPLSTILSFVKRNERTAFGWFLIIFEARSSLHPLWFPFRSADLASKGSELGRGRGMRGVPPGGGVSLCSLFGVFLLQNVSCPLASLHRHSFDFFLR